MSRVRSKWVWRSVVLALGAISCLTPIRSVERVRLSPLEVSEGYQIDPVDSSAVFAKEGLRVKVRYLSDAELNAEIPGPENPFTYRDEVDLKRAYVPVRFTVFQVTVDNPTFNKVLLPPEKAVLITDRGKVLRAYLLTRADALGDPHNFETYWLSRGVQSGNIQKLYLERMSMLRASVYHPDSFIFKGSNYMGKLIFDPLPRGTREVSLQLENFVLEFGIYDIPRAQVNLKFNFAVHSDIVEAATRAQTAGR